MADAESAEMYLETIYILSKQLDNVRKIDVSKHLNYAKPSITRGISLLEKRGLVEVDDSGSIIMTAEGKKLAKRIYDRHTTLTQIFMCLGVDEQTATDDACRIEHYISDKTFNAIKKHLKSLKQ
ncbi:MAG: metal-dependent transcriptional regulator [Clostridia bacterium]|nr:metal-dependent transcriptional regulator [Clostridia bacterium]MBR0120884.1 metal-dependent transcriptional regulator [Clostridia bacterium]